MNGVTAERYAVCRHHTQERKADSEVAVEQKLGLVAGIIPTLT
jgi:hypothetical protein